MTPTLVADETYRAAVETAAVFDHGDRLRLRVYGRAPRQMLDGILTGTLPAAPEPGDEGVLAGTATYHAVLTPKGKMVTDLWAYLADDEEERGFLLDVPAGGRAPFLEHLEKVLPPRFARREDVSETTSMLVVTGPDAAALLSRIAFGLRVEAETLSSLPEGGWRMAGAAPDGMIVARTRDVRPDAYRVVGDEDAVRALRSRLVEAGAAEAGSDTWDILRVEAGRPAFGTDMTDGTIPVEAGIHDRAIDYQKGCYTGQEVIVRIRDRGRVNRHLRRLVLGDVPVPELGTELFSPDDDQKAAGWITSAVRSPAEGAVVALAYVRRGIERIRFADRDVPVG